ncbi:MAG: hypothetical protein AB7O24_19760 [Kofleriaceae bacterium]
MNPRLVAGATFTDGKLDTSISDPDVRWDAAAQTWRLYYGADHAMTATYPPSQLIRHATSADRVTWNVADAPALAAATDGGAWDNLITEAPTVVYNPDAPIDRRYLMLYAGASEPFPHPGYDFAATSLGAAISADGVTFTRISASESPKGQAGLVLTGADVYPSLGTVVADPELALVDGVYQLWFSSFGCKNTNCATVEYNGISHATSSDGVHWEVKEAPVRSLLRAAADLTSGGSEPSMIYDAEHCRWEAWLVNDAPTDTIGQTVQLDNMAGVWYADSTDGITWHINYAFTRALVWDGNEPGEGLGIRRGADVGANGTGRLMLFVGYDDQNVPMGFELPDSSGTTPGVMTLNVATRDLQ